MKNNYFTFKNSRMLPQFIFSSFFYGQIKIIKNSLLILIILLLTTTKGYSQCTNYPTSGTGQVGNVDYTFCIDNANNTLSTVSVNAGQYVVVNVVKGFNYTFSVGNVFTSDEVLTLFNATGNVYLGSSVRGTGGVSIPNWTSTLSGKIKILLSKDACVNDGSTGGVLTLKLNSIGNTQDSQTSFGTDQWIGQVYNWTGNPPPGGVSSPITPASATYPFTTANYVGNYNIATETINEDFGGDTACFPVTSAVTKIYTETFAVRYRMLSKRAAGYYILNVSGDDGIRVYVDDQLVFNEWKQQSIANYCNNLVYLNGNSTIVFDYYENSGKNQVNFSLAPLNSLTNSITGPIIRNVCSGTSPGLLDATSFSNCAGAVNSGILFQWQSSTDNITFTSISEVTTEDYTPPAISGNDVHYYRRLVKSKGANSADGGVFSNVITVYTGVVITSTAGTNGQIKCLNTPITNITYNTGGATGATVTGLPAGVSGSWSSNVVTISGTPTVSGTFNYIVTTTGGCTTPATTTGTITVNSTPATPGFITGNANQCAGNTGQIYSIAPVANATGYVWSVPAGWNIISGKNTTSITVSVGTGGGNISVNAVNSCGTGYASGEGSGYKDITVSPPTVAGTLTPANTVVCGTTNSTNLNLSGNVGAIVRWESSTDNFSGGTITPIANTGSPYTAQNVALDTYYRAVVQSGGCSLLYSNSVKITHQNNVGTLGAISGSVTQCAGSTSVFSVDPVADAASYTWTVDTASGWSILSGQGTNAITVKIGTNSANVSVIAKNSCSISEGRYLWVTVSPTLPVSVSIGANPGTSVCAGSLVKFTATPTNGGTAPTYQWRLGSVNISGATSSTYTTTTLNNNDKISVVMVSDATTCLDGSPATSNTITMVVTPTNTLTLTSAATTNNQTICFNTAINPITYTTTGATGIGIPTNLPTGVSATWSVNIISISGTPTASGTFNYSIPLTGGCGTINATGTITVGANSTFNGMEWDNGLPNNNGLNAVIEGSYNTSSGNINACNCDVKSTGILTISGGTTVIIQNNITNNGTLTVNEGGNLIQKNNAGINQGNIAVEKLFTFRTPTAPIVHRQQYNYVISPVIGQVLKTIYPGTPATLYYNEATNYFGTSTGAYIAGRGLAIKEPSETAVSTSTVTAQFKGVPFNGILEYPLSYTASTAGLYGYNLVGNPYPSNFDLQSLYDYANGSDKNADIIEPTFQFWDNRGNLQFTQQGSGYSGDSYAKYNVIVGTGVASASAATNSQSLSDKRIPNQFVQVGTGFMVRALQSAHGKKLVFNNDMRTDNKGKSYFGKQSSKDRYWLTLKTPSAMELMNAVVYFEGGSNAVGLEDSKASDSSDGIYSISDDAKLAIQGRAPFADTDKVEVGLSLFTAGSCTISLLDTDGIFANGQNIYLKDKETGIITDLSLGAYTFNTSAGESSGRFEIIYKPETVLATDAQTKEELVVYKDQGDFVIKAQTKKITGVEVYDTGGRLIYTVRPNSSKAIIPADRLVNGVYVLKINQNGQITTKKIFR